MQNPFRDSFSRDLKCVTNRVDMPSRSHIAAARELMQIGRRFYARGWVMGTSGNFSAVVSKTPLRLAITASSVHKGMLTATHILELDGAGVVVGRGNRRASAEALLHVEIVRRRRAGAVLHTHSVWSTMLSDLHAVDGGLSIEGYEMLKGLDGVETHEHAAWIPIIDNDQDMERLSARLAEAMDRHPSAPAILLRRHGLYTWGKTLVDAERHVEILEFLFETVGRTATFGSREVPHGVASHS
jgi:methylthioribulose-1-phosphate dehydratase